MKCSATVFKHHSSHSDLPPHPSFHRRLPPIENTLHNIPSSGAHPWRICLISFMDSSLRSIDPFALCGHTHRYIPQGSKIKYSTLLRRTARWPASQQGHYYQWKLGSVRLKRTKTMNLTKHQASSIFLAFYSPTDSAALKQYIFEFQFIVLYRLFSM